MRPKYPTRILSEIGYVLTVIFFVSQLCSCATTPEQVGSIPSDISQSVGEQQNIDRENTASKDPAQNVPDVLTIENIVLDTGNSLESEVDSRPVFVYFSASWCEACEQMAHTAEVLKRKFGSRVLFFELVLVTDTEREETARDFPPCRTVSEITGGFLSLNDLSVLPRVMVFTRDGRLTADIEGLYPSFYYYGIIAEILQG